MIGAGSYGRVYMGLNEDTGALMAVKEVHIANENSKQIASLREEITLLASLRHDHIVRYLGTEVQKMTLFIFTEWVPGHA